ncbi:hypothetical protein ACFOOP_17925 [Marinicaulis aureus]|uniref:Uncharacterized protein n=1 Tax=Hyphococcus aureus TaxID=2666033 RepID=A0ABW1KVU7_9PROT
MASEREQSPHYIPELDPDNPASGPKMKQRFLWFLLLCGLSLWAAAAIAFMTGNERLAMILAIVGMIMIVPLAPGIG